MKIFKKLNKLNNKYLSFLCNACLGLLLTSCASNEIKSTPEYHSPPAAMREKMKSIMPSFEPWVAEVERKFALIGEPLTGLDLEWAQRLGIKNIDNIRIYITDYFPMPQEGELLRDLDWLNWGSPHEDARNMGYTIFLRHNTNIHEIKARQIAMIYLMEAMGRSRFLYRTIVEQRSLDEKDRPIVIEAKKISKCAPTEKYKISYACTFLGTKPINHKLFEEDRKDQEKLYKQQEKLQKEQEKQEKEKRKLKKAIQEAQQGNMLLDEIKQEHEEQKQQIEQQKVRQIPIQ